MRSTAIAQCFCASSATGVLCSSVILSCYELAFDSSNECLITMPSSAFNVSLKSDGGGPQFGYFFILHRKYIFSKPQNASIGHTFGIWSLCATIWNLVFSLISCISYMQRKRAPEVSYLVTTGKFFKIGYKRWIIESSSGLLVGEKLERVFLTLNKALDEGVGLASRLLVVESILINDNKPLIFLFY